MYLRSFWCLFNTIFHITVSGFPYLIISILLMPFIEKIKIQKMLCYYESVYLKLILWSSGITIHVYNIEKIDRTKDYVYVCNHTSFLDIPVINSILPYWNAKICKQSLTYIPIFGWFIKLSGDICINRSNTKQSIEKINNAINDIKKNPRSILLFPEGTRSCDDNLLPFKTGGIVLSIKTGLPILPIAICGCHDVFGRNINLFSKINTEQTISIIIGDPIDTENLDVITDKYNLTEQVKDSIYNLKQSHNNLKNPYKISLSLKDCFISF